MSDEIEPLFGDTDDPKKGRGRAMGFFDHLEELRWTLVKSAAAFIICAVIVGVFLREFNEVLQMPLDRAAAKYPELRAGLRPTSIMEGFNAVVQMCLGGGLMISAPFIAYFVGQFVSPALHDKEKRIMLPVCLCAVMLFVTGAGFSFYLLAPSGLEFAADLNNFFDWQNGGWTPGSYYSYLMWLTFGVGGTFEFPLVIVILVWMGAVTTAFLGKYRRHAIVVIVIIAAIVTPTQDPFNQMMLAVPLYLLYEIAILIGKRIEKRKAARAA